ncbi:DUF7848 domain-containing protein [Streptomyces sp. BA2]|uniref:DUF7848 domain-containing protein n=1 Tax=Streptomyces sp. BA2 TaxID=436595 RepID=UPI00132648D9|nr:hypothetical protein [Streptomyces sp. BA2]MWA12562.1 hypothetical protein [Streptomyces sp. BA2]
MTRVLYVYREYHVAPNQDADAEPVTHCMECVACEQASSTAEDVDGPLNWVFNHLKSYPTHLAYREHLTRPYRAEPRTYP